MVLPNFSWEKKLIKDGYEIIAGIDEVGRGAWAGPLTVALCCYPQPLIINSALSEIYSIRDSKRLTNNSRQYLFTKLKSLLFYYDWVSINNKFIDCFGIQKAEEKAIKILSKKLFAKFSGKKIFILVDYFNFKSLLFLRNKHLGIKKGDEQSITIASASIIAKVVRDKLMIRLSKKFPHYQWEKNKGYGTLQHQKAINLFGLSPYHRKTFIL